MSFIPRLFLSSVPLGQKEIVLDESSSRYLTKVLRLAEGARFYGFDPQSVQYELALKKADPNQAVAQVLSRTEKKEGSSQSLIALGQSMPKSAKMDLILRQGTEAGVHRFIPLITQRSISRPESSGREHKNERWQKILVEACRQCGRKNSTGKILILVGPEGGWSPAEVTEAEEMGAYPVHLPTPILRTETAGVAVVSMIQFFKSHSTD